MAIQSMSFKHDVRQTSGRAMRSVSDPSRTCLVASGFTPNQLFTRGAWLLLSDAAGADRELCSVSCHVHCISKLWPASLSRKIIRQVPIDIVRSMGSWMRLLSSEQLA